MKKVLSAIMSVAMVASFATTSAFTAVADSLYPTSDTKFDNDSLETKLVVDSFTTGHSDAGYLLRNDDGDGGGVVFWDVNGKTVAPDQDIYLKLEELPVVGPQIVSLLNDADDWKLKVKKNEGSKSIKATSLVDKNWGGRAAYLKIELNKDYTTDDNKVDLEVTITNKSKNYVALGGGKFFSPTGSITFDLKFWVQNQSQDADQDYLAGDKGVVLKPVKDDDNTITWADEIGDLARLTFTGDSDVNKFFPMLSTVWDNDDYRAFFNDQDAYMFNFVANPYLSSTSRALLEIYNPFIDEDDNATADPETIVIYQVVDGELVDVTNNFAFTTNEDGDEVYQTKTRQLGTYIFAEHAVEVADEPTVVEPTEPTTPDVPKDIPTTGRY